jgi:hypothetical protein
VHGQEDAGDDLDHQHQQASEPKKYQKLKFFGA